MALQELLNGLWVPELRRQDPTINVNTFIMDATGEQVVKIFRAPKTGNLQGFGANVVTVTNVPDSGLKFSFQGVSSAGLASGTILGATAGAHASTGAATPSATGWLDPGNFGEVVAVERGDYIAAVISFTSFAASDSIAFGGNVTSSFTRGFPYGISALTTKQTGVLPILGIRYDDGTYVEVGNDDWAALTLNQTTLTQATNPLAMGLKFKFPFPTSIDSVMWCGQIAGSVFYDIVFYDENNNVVFSMTVDGNVSSSTSTMFHEHLLLSPVTILPDAYYRVMIRPLTNNNIVFFDYSFNTAALMGTSPGGADWVLTTEASGGGGFTDYTTRKPRVSLRLAGIDIPTPSEIAAEVWDYFERSLT